MGTHRHPSCRYGAAKTVQEKMCIEFVAKMPEHKRFRFAAICPTAVRLRGGIALSISCQFGDMLIAAFACR